MSSTPMAPAPAAPPLDPAETSDLAPARRIALLSALALLHAEHGQPRRGLTYAMLAHALAPADAEARRALAFALLRNELAQEALDALGPEDPATPAPASETLLRAACHSALGSTGPAADAFWSAIGRADPGPALATSEIRP